MLFANPLLLFGLFAMAIPPLVQFFSRRRYDEVHWGAMQFLRLTPQSRRKLFLENWLLLVLRMGAIGALAFALAGPAFRSTLFADASARKPRASVMLIDCSGSMNRKHDGRTASDVAREWASAFLQQMRPGDRVAAFAVKGDVIPIVGSLTGDADAVRGALELLPQPRGTADWPMAIDTATKLLASAAEEPEIVVISDGQRLGWSDGETLARWDLLARSFVAEGRNVPRIWIVNVAANWPAAMGVSSLVSLTSNRSVATSNAAVSFEAGVRWEGTLEAPRVRLEIDGRPAGELTLPPTATPANIAMLRFARRFAPGSHLVTLRLASDRRDYAIEMVPAIPVLIVQGEPNAGNFLRDALAPANDPNAAFTVRMIPIAQFAGLGNSPRVLILANVASLTVEQSAVIEKFLSEGGGVFVAPGDRVEASEWNRVAYRNGRGWLPARLASVVGSEIALDLAPRPKTITFEHPAVRIFRDNLPGGLQNAYFPRYWKLEPDGAVLGRLTNDDPILIEKPFGQGRVIISAVPFDNSWRTNFTALPDFVRLTHELAYHLAGSPGVFNPSPGEPLVIRSVKEEPAGTMTIQRPDGTSSTMHAVFEGTRDPGPYILTTATGRTRYFAVQPDPREADLTPYDDSDREKLNHILGSVESVTNAEELRDRRGRSPVSREFGGLLLFAVLALLAGELWYTRRLVARGS